MTPIDINPIDLKTVQQILREKVPELEVRVFGSRASWTARETSDLDLVLMTKEPLDISRMAKLKESFSESNIPFRVDIVDWADTSENFRKIIEKDYVVVRKKSKNIRKMESKWRNVVLADCAEIIHQTVSPSEAKDMPYIGLEHIGKDNLQLLGQGKASNVVSMKMRFQHNDILFGKLRPYFRKVVMPCFDGICSTDIWVVRAKQGTDQKFLFYYMASEPFIDFATSSSNGTRMPRARWKYVSQYKIQLPPLNEQHTIAHILGTLDDKIELNRQINETLESVAKLLFKSWFVDFDPVQAKMEGRWHRGESLPGLPAHLYDFFSDRFVDSELGQIPDGWDVKKLNDVADMTRGRSYRSTDLSDSSVALVTLKSFNRGGGYRSEGLKPYTGPHKPEQIVKPGEVIVSCTDVTQNAEVIGRSAMVRSNPRYSHLIASLDIMIVRPNKHYISNEFLYLLSSTPAFTNHAYSYTTGTTVLHLAKDAIPSFRFVLPSSEITLAFGEIAKDIFSRIFSLEKENYTLTELRNALLPKLIFGELSVRNMINLGTTFE